MPRVITAHDREAALCRPARGTPARRSVLPGSGALDHQLVALFQPVK